MRRKKPEPPPTEGIDEPFGPPPEESLYRCSVCGEEMFVNEAIVDVGIGMAKFQREYLDNVTLANPHLREGRIAWAEAPSSL